MPGFLFRCKSRCHVTIRDGYLNRYAVIYMSMPRSLRHAPQSDSCKFCSRLRIRIIHHPLHPDHSLETPSRQGFAVQILFVDLHREGNIIAADLQLNQRFLGHLVLYLARYPASPGAYSPTHTGPYPPWRCSASHCRPRRSPSSSAHSADP